MVHGPEVMGSILESACRTKQSKKCILYLREVDRYGRKVLDTMSAMETSAGCLVSPFLLPLLKKTTSSYD